MPVHIDKKRLTDCGQLSRGTRVSADGEHPLQLVTTVMYGRSPKALTDPVPYPPSTSKVFTHSITVARSLERKTSAATP
jgi:hypothetical protein